MWLDISQFAFLAAVPTMADGRRFVEWRLALAIALQNIDAGNMLHYLRA